MYREYKVTGFKVEFRPTHLDAGNAPGFQMGSVLVGTCMDNLFAYPVNTTEFRASVDAKMYDAYRPFKRYYHVSRWSRT